MSDRRSDVRKVHDGIDSGIISQSNAYSGAKSTSFYRLCTKALVVAVSAMDLNLLDGILKKFETGKNITTSSKSIVNLFTKFGCKML